MNKVIFTALVAGGLLLLDSPEAAAHKEVRNVYLPPAHYHVEHRRVKHMPYWLKRNKPFRRWYKHSHAHRYRHMSWHRLYEIYLWERAYAWNFRHYDHGPRYYDDYRDYDDDRGYKRRGKHRGKHRGRH